MSPPFWRDKVREACGPVFRPRAFSDGWSAPLRGTRGMETSWYEWLQWAPPTVTAGSVSFSAAWHARINSISCNTHCTLKTCPSQHQQPKTGNARQAVSVLWLLRAIIIPSQTPTEWVCNGMNAHSPVFSANRTPQRYDIFNPAINSYCWNTPSSGCPLLILHRFQSLYLTRCRCEPTGPSILRVIAVVPRVAVPGWECFEVWTLEKASTEYADSMYSIES